MRISTAQIQRQGTNAMLERFSELAKTQLQLANGKRINKPSDDPLGSTQLIPLRDIIAIHEQYGRNANAAMARLSLEDSTLANVNDILTRVNDLTIQGNNDTLSVQDRAAVAEEMRQSLATLMGLANIKDGNGEYLFAGDNVTTTPILENPINTFSYQGDNGQRSLQIGATRQVAVGDPGDEVFVNIPFSGGGNQSIFTTIASVITNLQANTSSAAALTDIQSAMDNISTVRSKVGSRMNAIDSQRSVNDDLILRNRQTLSEIEDLDIAEAVGRMNLQLLGLQASQQAFNRIQNLSLFNYM